MSHSLLKTGLLLAVLCALLSPFSSLSQFRCGFDGVLEQVRRENPGFEAETNKKINDYIARRKRSAARMAGEQAALYHIPVVVHVIHTGGAVGTAYNPTDATIIA